MTPVRRATLREVAAQANVSLTTASLVLNGRGSISDATRARVHRVADELHYSPNVRAVKLRRARSFSIALITALPKQMLSNKDRLAYYRELALPAAAEAMDRGYNLTLLPPIENDAALARLDVDGAVVVDPSPHSELVQRLHRRHIPIVTIGAAEGLDVVAMVDRGIWGVDAVIDHFIANGMRHLAYVQVDIPTSLTSELSTYISERSRQDGFTLSTPEVAMTAEPEVLSQLLSSLIDGGDPPDAVYSPWSFIAGGLMQLAISQGIEVPEEMMFATNYNNPGIRELTPALTSLELKFEPLAATAVDLLLRYLAGESVPNVVASPKPALEIRQSSQRLAAIT